MKKKGQFYLIVAVIIIAIIAGLVIKLNLARINPTPLPFTELSENFEIEAVKIIDRGIFEGKKYDAIQRDLQTFITQYSGYASTKTPKIGFLYVFKYGDKLTVMNFLVKEAEVEFQEEKSQIIGGSSFTLHKLTLEVSGEKFVKDFEVKASEFRGINLVEGNGELVKLNIGGIPYNIALTENVDFTSITIECTPIEIEGQELEECYVTLTKS